MLMEQQVHTRERATTTASDDDEDDVDDATHGRSMMVIDLTCVVRVDALHLVEVL